MKSSSTPSTPVGSNKLLHKLPTTTDKNAPKISPLTSKFWNDLTRLEEELKQKTFTFTTIDELVQLYAKAIEFYDSMKDPIKVYFMEKIQITLSSKESLRLIINEKEKEKEQKLKSSAAATTPSRRNSEVGEIKDLEAYRTRSRMDSIAIDEISDDEDEDPNEKEMAKMMSARKRRERQSFSKTRLERAQFVNMFVKVQSNKKQEEKFYQQMIQEFEVYTLQNDQLVKNDLSTQVSTIRHRLEQKKVQSFLNQDSALYQKLEKSYIGSNVSLSSINKREKKIDEIMDELDANDGKFVSPMIKNDEDHTSNYNSPDIVEKRALKIQPFSLAALDKDEEGLEKEEKDENANNRSMNSLSPIRKTSFEQPKMNFEITLSFTKDHKLEEDKQITSPTLPVHGELHKENFQLQNNNGEKIKVEDNNEQIDSPNSEFQVMSTGDSQESG